MVATDSWAIDDQELRDFLQLIDDLADNTTGAIGARQFRSIVKSLVPRYSSISVWDIDVSEWGGEPINLAFADAADARFQLNGWEVEGNGALTYSGKVPMFVKISPTFSVSSSDDDVDVYVEWRHTNAFAQVNELLLQGYSSVRSGSPTTSFSGVSSFLATPGSQLFVNGSKNGAATEVSIFYNLTVEATMAVPPETEVRRGSYGANNTAGSVFSDVPFRAGIYHILDVEEPPVLPNGTYGLVPGTTLDPNSTYVPEGNNLLKIVGGVWDSDSGDGAKVLIFTSEALSEVPDPPRPSSDIGENGDFIAYGYPTDLTVKVWGPKIDGVWPVFPVEVQILPATS